MVVGIRGWILCRRNLVGFGCNDGRPHASHQTRAREVGTNTVLCEMDDRAADRDLESRRMTGREAVGRGGVDKIETGHYAGA